MIGSYRVGGVIGKGSYATVRLAKSWKGKVYAMKIYETNTLIESSFKKNIDNSIKVLQNIEHPNLLKYYETIYSSENVSIVTQVIENHSLLEYLRMQPQKKASENNAKIIIKDLLKGLAYLHRKNIVHRDLKL